MIVGHTIAVLGRCYPRHGLFMHDDVSDDFDEAWSVIIRENLKRLRRARGLSQQALCDAAGLKIGTYGPVESGHDRPNLRVLTRAAQALAIDPSELFGTPPATVPPASHAEVVEGGVVTDLGTNFLVASVDLPALEVRRGDVLTLERGTDVFAGALVLVDEDGVARLHLVRTMNPTIMERDGAPPVVFDARHHQVIGVIKTQVRRRDRT